MELHGETRDGLRVLSIDSRRSTMRATLFFRVGQADETLATSGWTHLIEHSALHGWKDPRLAFNASVGLYATRFDLDGEPDAVVDHLRRLGTWLAEPDLSRVEHESKVLRAESEQRPVGNISLNLEWRYGAQGPGLPAYRELGLTRSTPDGLRAWCRERFTADNAVLACDARLPDSVLLGLARGDRHPAVLPPTAAAHLPGVHRVASGVTGSAVVSRSFAASLAPEVLSRTLTETLRDEEGTAYAPWADLERVDGDTALLLFGTDVSSAGRSRAGATLARVLRRLELYGPEQAMLDEMAVSRSRFFRDEQNAPSQAWAAAFSVLTCSEVYTLEQSEALSAAVTPDDLSEVFREVRRTAILGLPEECSVPNGYHELTSPPRELLDATSVHKHVDGLTSMRVGDHGIQAVAPSGSVTVPFDDVAGLVAYPDGGRRLISRDGWSLTVEPALLQRGNVLTAALEARVPPELVLPHPPRQPEDIPVRPSLAWRVRRRARVRFGKLARVLPETTSGWIFFGVSWFLVINALKAVVKALTGP
ncbi:zinc protease [Humibacillus xanthopallidus]|uniref:Zinc protease n=1 Tax=Humibacillus xanthopallidus TaxID=412689 RepID=A0A543PP94_9MICO|nr:insulinase family protein [Humibacillus xanthopallidus]TQN45857.1 zinc protease [Humibacillus xanthopallidus]